MIRLVEFVVVRRIWLQEIAGCQFVAPAPSGPRVLEGRLDSTHDDDLEHTKQHLDMRPRRAVNKSPIYICICVYEGPLNKSQGCYRKCKQTVYYIYFN